MKLAKQIQIEAIIQNGRSDPPEWNSPRVIRLTYKPGIDYPSTPGRMASADALHHFSPRGKLGGCITIHTRRAGNDFCHSSQTFENLEV